MSDSSVGQHSTGFVGLAPVTDYQVRCAYCNKLLANMVTRPWRLFCRHCKRDNVGNTPTPPRVIDSC